MAKTNVRGAQIADGSNGVDLQVDVTNTLPVANGGTGRIPVTIGSLLLGHGTGAMTEVAPGSEGNILTVQGGTWVSAAGLNESLAIAYAIAL